MAGWFTRLINNMDQATINRYQPGGDIYAQIVTQYGQAAADQMAAVTQSGNQAQINAALANIVAGPAPGSTSTLVNLYDQLTTDPLAAPVADANTLLSNTAGSVNSLLGNTIASLFKNPAILVSLALALFFYFGGANIIRGWIASKAK